MGERIGRRAVGGEGEMVAAGREARRGARTCSVRGGRMGACIVVLRRVLWWREGCDHMPILHTNEDVNKEIDGMGCKQDDGLSRLHLVRK